jgi:hypothetical protein
MNAANTVPVEDVEPPQVREEVGNLANNRQHVEEIANSTAVVVHVDGEPAGGVVRPAAVDVLTTEVLD